MAEESERPVFRWKTAALIASLAGLLYGLISTLWGLVLFAFVWSDPWSRPSAARVVDWAIPSIAVFTIAIAALILDRTRLPHTSGLIGDIATVAVGGSSGWLIGIWMGLLHLGYMAWTGDPVADTIVSAYRTGTMAVIVGCAVGLVAVSVRRLQRFVATRLPVDDRLDSAPVWLNHKGVA